MVLSTLGEWAGSAIIGKLVDTAYSYLAKHMLPADTEADLNRLQIALPKITAVMGVAEALKFKHPNSGADAWIEQFRLAFQKAEDVLDELEYRKLEDMVKNRDQVSGFFSSIVGSLKRKFSSSTINDDTLRRLREVVKMLDLAATDVVSFFQLATALDVSAPFQPSSRETTSFLTESEVFGREIEKAKIIDWIKKPASQVCIPVFCIVGVGGLGKTTLAQLIFQEMSGENHFEKIVWVCVSTSFSVEDITIKILEELGEVSPGGESLNGLQKKLKEKILSKKIIFILDDVWNDGKMCDWEKLMAPLKFVQQGTKILLTTRMKSVADMIARVLNVEREYLVLRGLEEQELLFLFNKYAFQGFNPNNHQDLQSIGNKIAKMLHGSPLAAKVIGSLLNERMDVRYWEIISTSDSLVNERAKDLVNVLKLSYYYLPADLQQCFRFCSIFPQDYEFEKNELIRMWMASGFIRQQHCREERPEDIGEEYFNHLLRKSFFECYWSGYYVMHDLMHDLARNVSNGECCRVERNDKLVTIPMTTQHVSVQEGEIERIFHLKNLRTLLITPSWDRFSLGMDENVLLNDSLKETLRLLIIDAHHRCELPEKIGSMIHLRYLSIEDPSDRLGHLYEYLLSHPICKLYHLQVLKLSPSYGLGGLKIQTTGITNLVSLRYMGLPEKTMQNIHGVHKLTSLQELTFFVGQESGYQIDELKNLNNLRHLSIRQIENVRDPAEAKNADLSKKKSLISLTLEWTDGSNYDNAEEIIDNLQPHPNLKELTISYYKGHISPIWMKDLPSLDLSILRLSYCPAWEDLPFLGQMPHLKELDLVDMGEVKEVHHSFDSTRSACPFPSLEHLYCHGMPKLESWIGPHGFNSFPNVEELLIEYCPKLTKLPAMPLSLSNFELDNVGLDSLPDIYYSSSITAPEPSSVKSSLTKVEIRSCPNLKSLNGFLQQENLDLHAIRGLIIKKCENLVQLPIGAFGKFVSLERLSIMENPRLVAVDNQSIILPMKLQSLSIGNCGELDVPLLELASGLTTLSSLYIENSTNITRIPSSENAFGSLTKLRIRRCDKLVELSSMDQAHGVNPVSLKISELYIDHHSLLLIEPLRSLRCVTQLLIYDCSGMEALPEEWLLQNSSTLKHFEIYSSSSLRSLPGTMVRLTVLKTLRIWDAPLLEELPELPTSLIEKMIEGSGGRLL